MPWRQQFEINAIGPLFAVKALRSKLAEGAKVRRALGDGHEHVSLRCALMPALRQQVVLISSKNGSVTEVDFTGGELVRRLGCRRRHGYSNYDFEVLLSQSSDCMRLSACLALCSTGTACRRRQLNIAGVTLARDLKSDSVSVALIHPGVVCCAPLPCTDFMSPIREGAHITHLPLRA